MCLQYPEGKGVKNIYILLYIKLMRVDAWHNLTYCDRDKDNDFNCNSGFSFFNSIPSNSHFARQSTSCSFLFFQRALTVLLTDVLWTKLSAMKK